MKIFTWEQFRSLVVEKKEVIVRWHPSGIIEVICPARKNKALVATGLSGRRQILFNSARNATKPVCIDILGRKDLISGAQIVESIQAERARYGCKIENASTQKAV